jgi:hypothetical protein
MARTAEGAALSTQHRAGQLRLRAQALQAYSRVWPVWQGDEPSFKRLVDVTFPLVTAHRRLSSSLAASYYETFRSVEKVKGRSTPALAGPLDEAAVSGTLFVTGRDMTAKAIAAGASPQAAMQLAFVRSSGTVGRFVLGGGRDTIVRSSSADPQAQGYARVTGADPCAFCAMIASRGPVFSEDTADFEAHDHCSCAGEPVYEGSEWPGEAREYKRLWNEHASSAENPLAEFRRVLSARE